MLSDERTDRQQAFMPTKARSKKSTTKGKTTPKPTPVTNAKPCSKAKRTPWFSPFGWGPVRAVCAIPSHTAKSIRGAYEGWVKSRNEMLQREKIYSKKMKELSVVKEKVRAAEQRALSKVMGYK